MALEKDKKDLSKYYLSYPKPPVLDMKWENHDINVAEWVNIPKCPPLLNGENVSSIVMEVNKTAHILF